jgi:hypothetical protein
MADRILAASACALSEGEKAREAESRKTQQESRSMQEERNVFLQKRFIFLVLVVKSRQYKPITLYRAESEKHKAQSPADGREKRSQHFLH